MLLQGNLGQAILWVNGCNKGVLLLQSNMDDSTREMLTNFLWSNHINPTSTAFEEFHPYDLTLVLINFYITSGIVDRAEKIIQGAEGPGLTNKVV